MNPFGVPVKSIVGKAFKGKLDTLTYVAVENTYDPIEGTQVSERTEHACDGYVDGYSAYERRNSLIEAGDKKIIIIADSLEVEPTQSGKIEFEGQTYTIENIDPDPAGATYTIQGR